MYISGTTFDFENRLHQQPTGSGELGQYYTEFLSRLPDAKLYPPIISGSPSGDLRYLSGHWIKEGIKKDIILHTHYWSGYLPYGV